MSEYRVENPNGNVQMFRLGCTEQLLAKRISRREQINGVVYHISALYGYTGPWTTWTKEKSFGMNHASAAGLIA